jgi:hypothetical protein
MTIGIAIPNYYPYAKWMPRLLDNIAKQTILPTQVSVAMSECHWQPKKKYPFEIIVNDSEEVRGLPTNSNIALSALTTDIMTIMHGDDLMHFQRNQLLLWAFTKPEVKAVVHGFRYGKKADKGLTEKFDEVKLKLDYINTIVPNKKYPVAADGCEDFLNGHIAFRREIFDEFKYDEEEFYDADSEYNRMLVLNGIYISYIPQPLVMYIHRNLK